MRKPGILAAVLALAALLAAPLQAGICVMDDVPAATLLLPYFEVDLDHPSGISTLLSINNAGSAAVVAHVVLWTDLSVATLAFDVYLTGYDVQTINLRDLFDGVLPRTASLGQDPTDQISPGGSFSQDVDFDSCDGLLPPPTPSAFFVTGLRRAHTGKFSANLNNCGGRNFGDEIARGFVTVDAMNRCTVRVPGDPGYFAPGGTGDASNKNVLWGDTFYLDSTGGVAEGETLIHIEASNKNPETSSPGQNTFYGRHVGWTAADQREPLASHFLSRYYAQDSFALTDLVVWRDPKVNQGPFPCGVLPSWYPLGQEQIVVFDDKETVVVFAGVPNQPPPFSAAAQRTRVGGASFPVPFAFGWVALDLNATVPAAGPNPPEDPAAAQAWVMTLISATGGGRPLGLGYDAIHSDSACTPSHAQLGPP
ncbi:MAG TPA: hypothetical protein VN783_10320 [Thermoanaerobaculia bacterium]|nr:hypothetical protein [Thermoanaerobaculia bacterium]